MLQSLLENHSFSLKTRSFECLRLYRALLTFTASVGFNPVTHHTVVEKEQYLKGKPLKSLTYTLIQFLTEMIDFE